MAVIGIGVVVVIDWLKVSVAAVVALLFAALIFGFTFLAMSVQVLIIGSLGVGAVVLYWGYCIFSMVRDK